MIRGSRWMARFPCKSACLGGCGNGRPRLFPAACGVGKPSCLQVFRAVGGGVTILGRGRESERQCGPVLGTTPSRARAARR
jgi:hypothetical protein